MDWWKMVVLTYALTGVVRILIDLPFFLKWKDLFDNGLSSLQAEQMSKVNYVIAFASSLITTLCFTWLLWPIVKLDANK